VSFSAPDAGEISFKLHGRHGSLWFGAAGDVKKSPANVQTGSDAASLRRSVAAAVNELSAERRIPDRKGGVEKPVERAFGAIGNSPKSACCISTMDVSCYYFCKV
jgi:hypothetical protein